MTVEMHEYTYNHADRKKPHWYENQDRQHDPATATVWALHFPIDPPSEATRDKVLDIMSTFEGITGEYTYGDSWVEWGAERQNPDDETAHMVLYFRSPHLHDAIARGAALAAALERFDVDMSLYDVSTSADYAEIIPREILSR